MNALLLLLIAIIAYIVAYHTYGSFLSNRIFSLSSKNPVPSKEYEDGEDYVPTKKSVIFGHHFTSIAGTGPIVGPAIGVIWGWVPAVLWIFFGSIFLGAVHDFSSVVISLRNQGKTIADITGKYISKRVRLIFYAIVFLALLIVIAIFGLVIAIIFARFPESVIPVWSEIPIAMLFGYGVSRHRSAFKRFAIPAKLGFLVTFALGVYIPLELGSFLGIPATGIWTLILLLYAYIASVLPVSALLQPRDYLNAWQLFVVLALIVAGIVLTNYHTPVTIIAPMYNPSPEGAPSMWPFLFITIACGAISGFHSLVGSGTTSKQIKSELDAKSIGFGSMLLEGVLALVVVVSVTAGIGLGYTVDGVNLLGPSAWYTHYGSWEASAGLGSKLSAVVIGTSNFLMSLGISQSLATTIIGVFIASFAATTLDSSTRIQRYIISEMTSETRFKSLSNKWISSAIAVLSALALAFWTGADGKGALMLWPLFGAVNQLLAALALLIATIYLRNKGPLKWLVTGIPFVFVVSMTLWASVENQITFMQNGDYLLSIINLIIKILASLMILESVKTFFKLSFTQH